MHSSNEKTGRIEGSPSHPKLFVLPVPSFKKQQIIPTRTQSTVSQSLCAYRAFSINKHVSSTRLSPKSGLGVQGRSFPSLFQFANSPVTSTIFASALQGRNTRNDLPSVRAKYSSEGFRVPYKLDCANPPRERPKNNSVFRRFFTSSSKSRYISPADGRAIRDTGNPWISSELREVGSCPAKIHHISRHRLASLDKSQTTATRKDMYRSQKTNSSSENRQGISKRTPKPSRVAEFCKFCGPPRQIKPQVHGEVLKHSARVRSSNETHFTSLGTRRDELVASKLSSIVSDSYSTSDTLLNNGRFGYSMGRTTQQPDHVRRMGHRRTASTLQRKGDVSHSKSARAASTKHVRRISSHSIGQSIDRSLSSERGRDQIPFTHERNLPNSTNPGPSSDSIQNLSHPWEVQQSRRLFIQTPAVTRVALNTELYRNDLCKNGNACDRPICIQNRTGSSELRNPRLKRSRSVDTRCFQRNLEFSLSMDIPTTIPHPQSVNAPQSSYRHVSRRSPTLGEGLLAGGSKITCNSSPLHSKESETVSDRHNDRTATPEGTGNGPGGLEMWGWEDEIKGWEANQVSLLKASWRSSTWKTYKAPWNRWKSWAELHDINPMRPRGPDLAQFLADLYLKFKLSYNTVLLHKSVVSTLCNTELSGKLSDNVLVKHILKAISLKNPITPKPPIWDINTLTHFMSNYSVDSTNIFQTVRHTVALLCLCSGRRIHDLTLLGVDEDQCIIKDDHIILWPQFGSKTDCKDYRQSGWKLMANSQNQNLNPVYWVSKTITILNERRRSSGKSNLFITLRGPPSPASRTVIAGWFKSLLKAADISATPGSVRSAVASRSWIDNFSLDDILEKGNWKSVKTFQKFYRREVMTSSLKNNTDRISTLFVPVR